MGCVWTLMSWLQKINFSPLFLNFLNFLVILRLLQDILGSFGDTEIWYVEDGNLSSNKSSSGSFRRIIQRKEEKWWLPVPCVPPLGLSEKSRKQLQHKRECANQILKAAMVINSSILDEMEVPETYLATLPKVSYLDITKNMGSINLLLY